MDIRPILNDDDHHEALKEIERLWNAPEGSADHDKLDALATLVVNYEESRWPVEQLSDLCAPKSTKESPRLMWEKAKRRPSLIF